MSGVPRVALVTGASRGIGRASALRLAADGHDVAISYRRRADEARAVALEVQRRGRRAIALAYELGDRESARALVHETRVQLGDPLVLVNNAAVLLQRPFVELGDEDWSQMLAANLQGPFQLVQECLPGLRAAKWGRIVNLVSIGGQIGGTLAAHYAASKAGLLSLTRSIARAFAGEGITCNAVSPGLVATELIAGELATPAGRDKLASIPIGRMTSPEEIAALVAFLCRDEAATLTGQVIGMNGGLLIA